MTEARRRLQHLALALFSPALALYVAVKSRNSSFIVFAGTLFMGFVGSTFIYVKGNDGHSHLMDVYSDYLDMSLVAFFQDLGSLLLFQPTDTATDVYKHVISYLAGGVFGVPELIHVFGGLLLGYFFTKSVLLVLEPKPKGAMGVLLVAFIALFLMSRSISALNSLRMWTGMWVFFYGALLYAKQGRLKDLWPVGLAVLIHFSYLLYTLPLLLALGLHQRKWLVVGLFVASFFTTVGFEQASGLVESSGLYQDKAKYTVVNQDTLDRRRAEQSDAPTANFYKEFGPTVYKSFSTLLLAFTLIVLYFKNKQRPYLDVLITSGLLILALSNLAAVTSPAVNGRGYTIAGTFLVAAAIQVLCMPAVFLKKGFQSGVLKASFLVFLVSAIPYVLFNISYIINTISFFVFINPSASWLAGAGDFSIRDVLILDF